MAVCLHLLSGVTEHALHRRVETLARHQMVEAYLIQWQVPITAEVYQHDAHLGGIIQRAESGL